LYQSRYFVLPSAGVEVKVLLVQHTEEQNRAFQTLVTF